jgi:ankyrin repeat protein
MTIDGVLATLDRTGRVVKIPLIVIILAAGPYLFLAKIYLPRRALTPTVEQLLTSARRGDAASVRQAIAAGAGVDVPDTADGQTALMRAAAFGHAEVVSVLLASGAEASRTATTRETALHVASERGHPDVVRLLIRAGAPIDQIGGAWEETPLEAALRGWQGTLPGPGRTPQPDAPTSGQFEAVVAALVDAHADTNRKDCAGPRPLSRAASKRAVGLVRELLRGHADPNAVGSASPDPPLVLAADTCYGPESEIVTLLLQTGARPELVNGSGKTAFAIATDRLARDRSDTCRRVHEAVLAALTRAGARS